MPKQGGDWSKNSGELTPTGSNYCLLNGGLHHSLGRNPRVAPKNILGQFPFWMQPGEVVGGVILTLSNSSLPMPFRCPEWEAVQHKYNRPSVGRAKGEGGDQSYSNFRKESTAWYFT